MPEFTTLAGGMAFSECPRWRNGRLYVADQHAHRVLTVTLDGVTETVAHIPNKPGGLGFLPDGRLLIVSMRDRKIFRLEADGALTLHADLSVLVPWPINDMLVDAEGRARVGNFGFDLAGGAPIQTTSLICVEPDGTSRLTSGSLGFPNGMVLAPDGRTLIVAETLANRLSAFDVNSGELGERRTWAAFGPPPQSPGIEELLNEVEVAPDGICLDAEGAVWVADIPHNRIIRVAEGGRILDELSTGDSQAFACMLGGDDGRTLFACVAPTFHEDECTANPGSAVLIARVQVPHAGLP